MHIAEVTDIINPLSRENYSLFIDSKEELKALRNQLGVREDWHEPDEAEVSVSLVNPKYRWDLRDSEGVPIELKEVPATKFDNAFGDKTEAHIVIRKDGKVVARVNLANLLALACEAGK